MSETKIAKLIKPSKKPHSQTIYQIAWNTIRSRPEAIFSSFAIAFFIFMAIFAQYLAPFPLMEIHFGFADLPPSWVKDSPIHLTGDPRFLLGTDTLGRDLLTLMIFGTRTSIFLGLFSAPLIALIGTLYGLISGYIGGKTDYLLMRIADIFSVFPTIIFYIMIVLALKSTPVGKIWNGIIMIFIAILSVGWVSIARLIRSNVLAIKKLEFIEAAQAIGAKPQRIMFKHIFPNVLSSIIVWITYMVPQIILIESILGYLGIGMNGSDRYALFSASWGGMFSDGRLNFTPNNGHRIKEKFGI